MPGMSIIPGMRLTAPPVGRAAQRRSRRSLCAALRELRSGQGELRLGLTEVRDGLTEVRVGIQTIVDLLTPAGDDQESGGDSPN